MPHIWENSEGSARVSLDEVAAEGVRTQAIDAFLSLPRRGAESGGLLLGEIESATPLRVNVSGFESLPCEYRFGPSFVLSETDRAALGKALTAHGPSVVGLYRSYTGREPALDSADLKLVESYFSAEPRVFLLVRPLTADQCEATFAWSNDGRLHAPPPPQPFPFAPKVEQAPTPGSEVGQAATPYSEVGQALPPVHGREATTPPPETPPPARPTLPPPVRRRYAGEETVPSRRRPRFWLPLLACVALSVGAAFVYEWWRLGRLAPVRSATRVESADRVAPPPVIPPAAPAPAVTPPPVEPEPSAPARTEPLPRRTRTPRPRPSTPSPAAVAAVPIHKVQPGISDAIRARISGKLVVPVRVTISESGRVTSAVAQKGRDDAVYRYVSTRAATAARLWRFEPARSRNGARIQATQTLYFVFTR